MSLNNNVVFSNSELTAIYAMVDYEIESLKEALLDSSLPLDEKINYSGSLKTCESIKSKLDKWAQFSTHE